MDQNCARDSYGSEFEQKALSSMSWNRLYLCKNICGLCQNAFCG